MSVALHGFKVVTEFVFNADQALNGAEMLNRQVDKLSKGADAAINSIARLGVSYAMSFSGGTGGILGILSNAIKSSDKFKSTQIELANTMVANGMKINGSTATFNDALNQSDLIMEKIVKKARNFGISPDALTAQAKMFNNMLAPKGLSGKNLSQSIELARVSMKAAPALGVNSGQATSGIMSGISGQLSNNTQFGKRLFLESGKQIEKATGIKSLKEFNKAIPVKRIKALIVGLDKLAGSSETVKARADTLSSRIKSIGDLFYGVGSILKPIGDAILPLVKDTLDILIKYLKTDGVKIVKEISKFIKGFMVGPKEMIINLMQLKNLSSDFQSAIDIGAIALTIAHITELVEFLGENKYTAGISDVAKSIGNLITRIPIFGSFIKNITKSFTKMFSLDLSGGLLLSIKSIGIAMSRMVGFVAVLLIPLQGLSRAMAGIKIGSISEGISMIPKFMSSINSLWVTLKKFFAPIDDLIDGWAIAFSYLIGTSKDGLGILGTARALWNYFYGDISEKTNALASLAFTYGKSLISFIDFLDGVGTAFLALWGTLKGIVAGISAIVGSLSGGKFTGLGKDFMDAMGAEFDKTMNKHKTPTIGPDGSAQNTVTNYVQQDITMNNAFKEVLQPDRIAFTIKDQLEKSARNKVSSRASGFTGKAAMGI